MASTHSKARFKRPSGLTDVIHDFVADGNKVYEFPLRVRRHAEHKHTTLDGSHSSVDSSGSAPFLKRKWQIKHFVGSGTLSLTRVNTNGNPTSSTYTRSKFKDNDDVWRGIFGSDFPYTHKATTQGQQRSVLRLFHDPHHTSLGSKGWGQRDVRWKIFQKAVPIVKNGVGNVIQSGEIHINENAGTVFTFDSGDSYGGDANYEWKIEKLNVFNGQWQTATGGGTDYNLIGNLNDKGVISVDFVAPAVGEPPIRYRIRFVAEGYSTDNNPFGGSSTGNSGDNIDEWFQIIEVVENTTVTSTTETINLPTVLPVVKATNDPRNVVEDTDPLTGVGELEIRVEAFVDKLTPIPAKKEEVIEIFEELPGGGTNLLSTETQTLLDETSSDAAWIDAIKERTTIRCRVLDKSNGSVVTSKNGLGPHIFNLDAGEYDVEYQLRPADVTKKGADPATAGPTPG